jgi:predicted O-methyltransferase YrrM
MSTVTKLQNKLTVGTEVLRGLGHDSRKLLDRNDPLRSYNRRLAWAFLAGKQTLTADNARLMPTEGHMEKSQALYVQRLLADQPWVHKVAEVGFNAGHSSYLFLSSRTDIEVTSFDLGEHEYTHLAKWIIDERFPGRHELIVGDSRLTIPEFTRSKPDRKFDLVFIDGGHELEVAQADIENCRLLATGKTIVVMDDLDANVPWGVGPARAWADARRDGVIVQDSLVEDGVPVGDTSRGNGRTWGLGHYL